MPRFNGARVMVGASLVAIGTTGWAVTPAHATDFTYNGFSNTAGLNIVGDAATTTTADGTVLRVVPDAFNQAGAAYSTSAVTLGAGDTFSTQFNLRSRPPSPG